MDVTILRKSCIKYVQIFQNTLNINPFVEASTLAAAAMLGFRKNFLKAYTWGIVPFHGYNAMKKQTSKIADKWLEYENSKCNYKIIPEYKVPKCGIYVDGFNPDGISPLSNKTPIIYEFFGCYWQGHNCIKYRPVSSAKPGDTLDARYESTMHRLHKLKGLGYTICVMWECEFKKFLKENPEINDRLENSPALLFGPINPRDAIYGGLVDVFRTFYEIKPGERIMYYDFVSLYPAVMKKKPFPKGLPRIYNRNECRTLDILNLPGLIKCRILPPQNEFHPILPVKLFGHMVTPLCRTCAENKMYPCTHTNELDRALFGTWVLAEVNYALKHGYRMFEIFEVWSYQVETYDPISKTGGMFTEYLNKFVKMKAEASGWEKEMTDEEKWTFVSSFYEHEGIQLDIGNIKKNPAMRSIAKLLLNTLWGKTIQQALKTQSSVFNDPQ